jgi:hypothetical protein
VFAALVACSPRAPGPTTTPSLASGQSPQPTRAADQPIAVDGCPNYVLFSETGPLPTDFDENHPINAEHSRLEPDLEAARIYGEGHQAEFGSIRWENVPRVRVVIGFTDHLEAHCAALRESLTFPDEFELIWSPASESDKATMADEIFAKYREHLTSVGQGADVVEVTLRADGERAAAEIAATYGALVDIRVGIFHYPDRAVPEGFSCADLVPKVVALPLRGTVILESGEVRSGADFHGSVTVTNVGAQAFDFESGEPHVARVYAPATNLPIGTYSGGIGGVGRGELLQPGATISMDIIGGTASCDPAVGYAVPPGLAQVVVPVEVLLRPNPNDAPDIVYILSEPVPIRILP